MQAWPVAFGFFPNWGPFGAFIWGRPAREDKGKGGLRLRGEWEGWQQARCWEGFWVLERGCGLDQSEGGQRGS